MTLFVIWFNWILLSRSFTVCMIEKRSGDHEVLCRRVLFSFFTRCFSNSKGVMILVAKKVLFCDDNQAIMKTKTRPFEGRTNSYYHIVSRTRFAAHKAFWLWAAKLFPFNTWFLTSYHTVLDKFAEKQLLTINGSPNDPHNNKEANRSIIQIANLDFALSSS